MGKGGGGSPQPTQQTVTQTNLPEYAKPYFENLLNRTQAESYREYTPYQAERIAGFTPGEQAVQAETAGMQQRPEFAQAAPMAQTAGLGAIGFGGQAAGLGQQAAGAGAQYAQQATTPGAVQAYMSPYMQNVVDVQKQEAMRDAQQQLMQANLGAARQGTYGGARQLLAQSEANRNLQSQLANIQAAGTQKAFEAAQQAQQFGSTLGLQGLQTGIQGIGQGIQGLGQATQSAQTLGALGEGAQQSQLQRLQAQAAAAAQPRSMEQQRLDQAYADFLRQRDYPMEQLGYFSNILRGLPVQLGSTATTYAQPPSLASQLGGAGLGALGLYNLMQ